MEDSQDINFVQKGSQMDIEKIAVQAYYDCFANESRTVKTIKVKNVLPILSKASRGTSSDALLHVVNFEDNLGFAIISTSPYTTNLLAVSNQDNYDPTKDNDVEGFSTFIRCAERYVEISESYLFEPFDSIRPLINTSCLPKVRVLWGQRYPYGLQFTNGIAGCSNIATAQIMSYYKYPTTMQIHSSNTNYTLSLDWDEICLHKKTDTDCNESDCAATHNMIGTFIRQIGRDNDSDDYSTDQGTSTFSFNVLNSLRAHGYYCSPWSHFSNFDYKTYLRNDYLIFISGGTWDEIGHDWIMDGFKVLLPTLNSQSQSSHTYCHYNWGADGRYNGYFLEGVFCLTDAYQYDNEVGNDSYDYRYRVYCSAVKPNNNY